MLDKKPILIHTLGLFREFPQVIQRVLMLHPDDVEDASKAWGTQFAEMGVTDIVPGGTTRQETVASALRRLSPEVELVAIHDAARPFTPISAIREALTVAAKYGAAVVAVPVTSTLKRERHGVIVETVDRSCLWQAQTPQVFSRKLVVKAYGAAQEDGFQGTDDAQLVEQLGERVRLVQGDAANIKITTEDDLVLARSFIEGRREKSCCEKYGPE